MRGATLFGALAALVLSIFACGDDAGSGAGASGVDGGGSGSSGGSSGNVGEGGTPTDDGATPTSTFGWVKVFNTDELSPVRLAKMPSGDVIATMRFKGAQVDFEKTKLDSVGSWATAVLRISADGTVLWAVSISSVQYGDVGDFAVDPNGDVFLAGRYKGDSLNVAGTVVAGLAGRMEDDGFIARLDGTTGAAKWARAWTMQSGLDSRRASCVGVSAPTTTSVSFRCSVSEGTLAYGGGTIDISGLKGFIGALDPVTGDVTWSMTEASAYIGEGLTEDPNGDVLLVGNSTSSGSHLLKISKQSKTVAWDKPIADVHFFDTPLLAADGSIFLRGYADRDPKQTKSDSQALVLKVDANGTEQWRKLFGCPASDSANAIALDGAGAVVAVGDSDARTAPSTIDGRTLVSGGKGFFMTTLDPATGAATAGTGFIASQGAAAEDVVVVPAGTVAAGLAHGDFVLDKPRVAVGVGSVFVALFK